MKSFYVFSLFILASLNAWADDYDKIVARLQEMDQKPNTALFTLGQNDQGRDILGIVLGDTSRAITKHLVVGTHHGNERAAADLPFYFIEEILPQLSEDTVIYVVPVLNITGYNRSRREETGSDNKPHDANRDYEDACKPKADFQLKSTLLAAEFMEKENIIAAVSLHGYVGTFTYPWGTSMTDYKTVDDVYMEDWAKKAAAHNGYKTGTHGGAIYPAIGSFEDYAYFKMGVWSYLLEIKSPQSDLRKDAKTLVEFFKQVPRERSKNVGQRLNCVKRILNTSELSRP